MPFILGKVNVHDDHIRLVSGSMLHGLQAVCRLSDHFQIGIGLEDAAKPLTDHGMVIHEQHPPARALRRFFRLGIRVTAVETGEMGVTLRGETCKPNSTFVPRPGVESMRHHPDMASMRS